MHQLKITLKGVKPPVWRRLLVPSEYTLTQVHEALLEWTGGSFDPAAFDPAEVDQIFATLADPSG